jgi:hypothetical protein
MGLKSGDMVILLQKHGEDCPIKARRVPEAVSSPRGPMNPDTLKYEAYDRVVICNIPNGARVLYISSKRDAFRDAIAGRGKGPYGYRPGGVTFHFVLWGERPVWVSSEDAELRGIDAVPGTRC